MLLLLLFLRETYSYDLDNVPILFCLYNNTKEANETSGTPQCSCSWNVRISPAPSPLGGQKAFPGGHWLTVSTRSWVNRGCWWEEGDCSWQKTRFSDQKGDRQSVGGIVSTYPSGFAISPRRKVQKSFTQGYSFPGVLILNPRMIQG